MAPFFGEEMAHVCASLYALYSVRSVRLSRTIQLKSPDGFIYMFPRMTRLKKKILVLLKEGLLHKTIMWLQGFFFKSNKNLSRLELRHIFLHHYVG